MSSATTNIPEEQHNIEIHENLKYWKKKPVLQRAYLEFHKLISKEVTQSVDGKIVELGSGIGNLKSVLPEAICTDLFPNPWLDQVENAYDLSFKSNSVSNLVLFDVWHHLQYPGNALNEFKRVLKPGGRVILFEPYISLFGRLVFGPMHHEPIGMKENITPIAPEGTDLANLDYYAAQGNATRIFYQQKYKSMLANWNVITKKRTVTLAYILSGGYSKPQLYPTFTYPIFKPIDAFLGLLPTIFSTRLMVVLELK